MIMNCNKCNSKRVASVTAKCSDCCGVNMGDSSHEGYVPKDLGIGGGDYVEFSFCLDCGQLQGKFPLPPAEIEKDITDEEVVEFFDNHFVEGKRFDMLPPNIKRMTIDHAERVSSKLGLFISIYMDSNMGYHSLHKHPSAKKFVQMFREKDYYLE